MSTDLMRAQHALSVGSLGTYIHWANQFPMLSAEEEHDLGARLQENNNVEAAKKLILSHLRLVIRIARGYNGYGLPQADLIQEGNIGLMKAVKRFDPNMGVRLVSFAVHWIRAEMHEFILRNWRIVKLATTKAKRKLFFNLRKLTQKTAEKFSWLSEKDITLVAETLDVSKTDVRQMETQMRMSDQSIHTSAHADDANNDWAAPINFLADPCYNPENLVAEADWSDSRGTQLHAAFEKLDARSQDILQERWLTDEKKATLHDLAAKYAVSAERIRQLEQAAIKKLRTWMTEGV